MPEQPEHTAEVADPGAEAPVEAQGAPEVAGVSESSESSHPTESSETVEADVASESFEQLSQLPPPAAALVALAALAVVPPMGYSAHTPSMSSCSMVRIDEPTT